MLKNIAKSWGFTLHENKANTTDPNAPPLDVNLTGTKINTNWNQVVTVHIEIL